MCTATLSLAQTTPGQAAQGEAGYISNDLFIYMRAGPSPNFRLIGTINAGTPVTKLQQDGEYVQILDDRERTGWIEIEFYSATESLQSQIERITNDLQQTQSDSSLMASQNAALQQDLGALTTQNNQLNRELTEQLEMVSVLQNEAQMRDRNSRVEWLTRGAIIALVSVLVGFILGSISRKNRSRNRLM
jgi:SH3 domain protein